jgi:hypothetical protein
MTISANRLELTEIGMTGVLYAGPLGLLVGGIAGLLYWVCKHHPPTS